MYKALLITRCGIESANAFAHPSVDEEGNIVEEPWDRKIGPVYHAIAFTVKRKMSDSDVYETLANVPDIDMEIRVTDSRILFCCKQYEKGNVKSPIDLVTTGIIDLTRAIAKEKAPETVLAGHIRYEWLSEIHYKKKEGIVLDEGIRIAYRDIDGHHWLLTLVLRRDMKSDDLALSIVQRCLRYKNAMTDEKSERRREFLNQYMGIKELPKPTHVGQYVCIMTGHCYFAPGGESFRPDPDWKHISSL